MKIKEKTIELYGDMMGIDLFPLLEEFKELDNDLESVAYFPRDSSLMVYFNKELDNNAKKFIYDKIPYVIGVTINNFKILIEFHEDVWVIYKIGDEFINI